MIEGKFAFDNRIEPGDFLAVISGHGFNDGFSLGSLKVADADDLLTELLQPDTPIGIDHDFNGIGVLQSGYDVTCIAFKLAFGAFFNRQSG